MDVTETHQDILQNIEFAIVTAFDQDQTLLDLEVIDALDALIRRYAAECEHRAPPKVNLSEKASSVYSLAARTCEWRLGRELLGGDEDTSEIGAPEVLGTEEILACLKRIRKSVRFWNETAGRQGYLEYVSQFIG